MEKSTIMAVNTDELEDQAAQVVHLFKFPEHCIVLSKINEGYNVVYGTSVAPYFDPVIQIKKEDYEDDSPQKPEFYVFLLMVFTIKSSMVSSEGFLKQSTIVRFMKELAPYVDSKDILYLVASIPMPKNKAGSRAGSRYVVLISKPVNDWGIYIPITGEDFSSTAGYKYIKIPEEGERKSVVEKDYLKADVLPISGFFEPHRFFSYRANPDVVKYVAKLRTDWFQNNVLPTVKQYLHLQ